MGPRRESMDAGENSMGAVGGRACALGAPGGMGEGKYEHMREDNGVKKESMGTNSGGGWVHGGKDMGNGEGRGEEFGKEAAGKV